MAAGRAKEAKVQVIISKDSHLITSEAISHETESPVDRGANFPLNIYLRLGACRYLPFLSRQGLCELTTAHLHMTPRHSRPFSHFHNKAHLDPITTSHRSGLSGQNVIKASGFTSNYHNKVGALRAPSTSLKKETNVCVYLFELAGTYFKINSDLWGSFFLIITNPLQHMRSCFVTCPRWSLSKSSQTCSLFKVRSNMIRHLLRGGSQLLGPVPVKCSGVYWLSWYWTISNLPLGVR